MNKIGAPLLLDMAKTRAPSVPAQEFLRVTAIRLEGLSESAAKVYKEGGKVDERLMRMRLMLEELGELAQSLLVRDEVSALDAIADLVYVAVGTAVTYDLPVARAFDEVHRSNMSKDNIVVHESEIKGKGINYFAPDMVRVIKEHRNETGI